VGAGGQRRGQRRTHQFGSGQAGAAQALADARHALAPTFELRCAVPQQSRIAILDPQADDMDFLLAPAAAELDAGDESDPRLLAGEPSRRTARQRVVIREREQRHGALRRACHQLRRAQQTIGAQAVRVQVDAQFSQAALPSRACGPHRQGTTG